MKFFEALRGFLGETPKPEEPYLKYMHFTPREMQSFGYSKKEIECDIEEAKRQACSDDKI